MTSLMPWVLTAKDGLMKAQAFRCLRLVLISRQLELAVSANLAIGLLSLGLAPLPTEMLSLPQLRRAMASQRHST